MKNDIKNFGGNQNMMNIFKFDLKHLFTIAFSLLLTLPMTISLIQAL